MCSVELYFHKAATFCPQFPRLIVSHLWNFERASGTTMQPLVVLSCQCANHANVDSVYIPHGNMTIKPFLESLFE